MDTRELLRYTQYGESERTVEKTTDVNRKTVARYRGWATERGLLEGPLPPLGELHRLLKEMMNATPPLTPMLNRQQVLTGHLYNYICQKRNVLVCGPTGVGKTLLAPALVHEASRPDLDALFINTYRMLQHINGGRAGGTLERRVQTYLHPDLKGQDKTPHLCQVVSSEAQWSD